MKRIRINYKRFLISIGIFILFALFLILIGRAIICKNDISQEDYISFIKKTMNIKSTHLNFDSIEIQKLMDQTFLYKYSFSYETTYYVVYMKENKKIVYFKKTPISESLKRFTLRDAKREGFKWLYKLAPYTRGNVEIYVEETPSDFICNFTRIENDKKVSDNYAKVAFNRDNGEIIEFDINWFLNVDFVQGVKKGNEQERLKNSLKASYIIDNDSEVKYCLNNVLLNQPLIYYDYSTGEVLPKIEISKFNADFKAYNSYLDYALKRASIQAVKNKMNKIITFISSPNFSITFSQNKFKITNSIYSYQDSTHLGTFSCISDKLGNILEVNFKMHPNINKATKAVDIRELNDKAEEIFQVITGKYINGRSYRTTTDELHQVKYVMDIGGIRILKGFMDVLFDKKTGQIISLNYNLGFKPEFSKKLGNEIKTQEEFIKKITAEGFEEKYIIQKQYGKVFLFEGKVNASLVLAPRVDLSYMMNVRR